MVTHLCHSILFSAFDLNEIPCCDNKWNQSENLYVCGDRWMADEKRKNLLLNRGNKAWKTSDIAETTNLCGKMQTIDVTAFYINWQPKIDKSPYGLRLNRTSTFYKFITLNSQTVIVSMTTRSVLTKKKL